MLSTNSSRIITARRVGIFCALLLAALLARPPRDLDWEGVILPLAREYAIRRNHNNNNNIETTAIIRESLTPLDGVTIVVTGATSGIGRALTVALAKLGGTLVVVGRSEPKLAKLREDTTTKTYDSSRRVYTYRADLDDLASVAAVASDIAKDHPRVDILVNNAGMHAGFDLWGTATDAQGRYDRVFVVNYLSHVLLTEKLWMAGVLGGGGGRGSEKTAEEDGNNHSYPAAVVVQTASSFHWAVDGTDLDGPHPIAAQPGGSAGLFHLFRTQRSYANSKLAQLYHARALQERWNSNNTMGDTSKVRVVSFCPGWVATHIVGASNTPMHAILQRLAFPANGWGIASGLLAILDDGSALTTDNDDSNSNHKDYYISSHVFRMAHWILPDHRVPAWVYRYGLRDLVGCAFASLGLVLQNAAPEAQARRSSSDSYNMSRARGLDEWSRLVALKEYL